LFLLFNQNFKIKLNLSRDEKTSLLIIRRLHLVHERAALKERFICGTFSKGKKLTAGEK
jgi:hypothetical protein